MTRQVGERRRLPKTAGVIVILLCLVPIGQGAVNATQSARILCVRSYCDVTEAGLLVVPSSRVSLEGAVSAHLERNTISVKGAPGSRVVIDTERRSAAQPGLRIVKSVPLTSVWSPDAAEQKAIAARLRGFILDPGRRELSVDFNTLCPKLAEQIGFPLVVALLIAMVLASQEPTSPSPSRTRQA